MQPPFTCDYDEEADVLYITGSDNRPAVGKESEDSRVVLRYAIDNGDLVGITVLYVKRFV